MREIPLSKGFVALLDDEDLPLLAGQAWHATHCTVKVYARGSTGIYMHRLLLNAHAGVFVDHINGDGLDNRRCNLRFCTVLQNNVNSAARPGTSRFKGVSWIRTRGRWQVKARVNGKHRHIGYFRDEVAAAAAYDAFAIALHGEFARLNLPEASAA